MKFGEFVDKILEIYNGDERDYNLEVRVASGDSSGAFVDFVGHPGSIVLCDESGIKKEMKG